MTQLDFTYRSLSGIFGETANMALSDEQKRSAIAAMQARLQKQARAEQDAFARVRSNWKGR